VRVAKFKFALLILRSTWNQLPPCTNESKWKPTAGVRKWMRNWAVWNIYWGRIISLPFWNVFLDAKIVLFDCNVAPNIPQQKSLLGKTSLKHCIFGKRENFIINITAKANDTTEIVCFGRDIYYKAIQHFRFSCAKEKILFKIVKHFFKSVKQNHL